MVRSGGYLVRLWVWCNHNTRDVLVDIWETLVEFFSQKRHKWAEGEQAGGDAEVKDRAHQGCPLGASK